MSHAEAKHRIRCEHHIGSNVRVYYMRCDVLKAMPDGRIKVRVYGRLYWKGTEAITRTRYVEASRVEGRRNDQ